MGETTERITPNPAASGKTQTTSKDSDKAVPKATALFECHVRAGAKMVDFSGWNMPLHYGSQMDEHHTCRNAAAMFDVSHMTVLDFEGVEDPAPKANKAKDSSPGEARKFLKKLLANNIDKASSPGRAIYSCMLNEDGGVVDDLIAYWIEEDRFRLIVNAGTREKDLAWISQHLTPTVTMNERRDVSLLAIQGPQAIDIVSDMFAMPFPGITEMKRFSALTADDMFIARTGYTGEDGVEIVLPNSEVETLWNACLDAGIKPAGLGARDTLRLEAAMNLYGNDMDEDVTPLESGIAWTVGWQPDDREFIGRKALELQRQNWQQKGAARQELVGLQLEGRGVLRRGQTLQLNGTDNIVGTVTSGTFSPTLQQSIALARVSLDQCGVESAKLLIGKACDVLIRNKAVPARFVALPFVKP